MENLTALLERARRPAGADPITWYQLAKALDVSHARLWKWRRGTIPDNNGARAIAAQLKMPLELVIGYLEEDRARKLNRPQVEHAWSARLPRLLPSAATAGAGLLALMGALADGTTRAAETAAALPAIHYANLRRWLRRAHPVPA